MAVPNNATDKGIELKTLYDARPTVDNNEVTVTNSDNVSNCSAKVQAPKEVTEFKEIVVEGMMSPLNNAPENYCLLKGKRLNINTSVCDFLDLLVATAQSHYSLEKDELLEQLKAFNTAYKEKKAHLTVAERYKVITAFTDVIEQPCQPSEPKVLSQQLKSATFMLQGITQEMYSAQRITALEDLATRYLNQNNIPAIPSNVQFLRNLASRHLDSKKQTPITRQKRSIVLEQIAVSTEQQAEFMALAEKVITPDWVAATTRTITTDNFQHDFPECNCLLEHIGTRIYCDSTATYFCIEEGGHKRSLIFDDLKKIDIWLLSPNDVINLMSSVTNDGDTESVAEVVRAYYHQHKGLHTPSGVAFLMQIEKHLCRQGGVAKNWIAEAKSDRDLDLLAKLYNDISDPKIKAHIYVKLVREEKVLVAQTSVSLIGRFVTSVFHPSRLVEPPKYMLKPNYLMVSDLLSVAPEIFEGQAKAWLTPLFLQAAAAGDTQCLEVLHANGAKLSDCGQDGKAAIHYACIMNQLDTIKWLMGKDAKVLEQTKSGHYEWRPLIIAISCGNEKLFDFLVGSDLGGHLLSLNASSSGEGNQNIFHYLCHSGNEKYLKKVLESGKANLKLLFKQDSNTARNTPVHLAIKHGHYEVIKLLKEAAENAHPRRGRPAFIQHLWHDLITDENCKSLRGYNFESYIDTTGLTMAKKLQLKSLFTLTAPKKAKKQ